MWMDVEILLYFIQYFTRFSFDYERFFLGFFQLCSTFFDFFRILSIFYQICSTFFNFFLNEMESTTNSAKNDGL